MKLIRNILSSRSLTVIGILAILLLIYEMDNRLFWLALKDQRKGLHKIYWRENEVFIYRYANFIKRKFILKNQKQIYAWENRLKYRKHLTNGLYLTSSFHFKSKNKYLKLLHGFVQGQISAEVFQKKFEKRYQNVLVKFVKYTRDPHSPTELKSLILLNSKSIEFTSIINGILEICDQFPNKINAEELKQIVTDKLEALLAILNEID